MLFNCWTELGCCSCVSLSRVFVLSWVSRLQTWEWHQSTHRTVSRRKTWTQNMWSVSGYNWLSPLALPKLKWTSTGFVWLPSSLWPRGCRTGSKSCCPELNQRPTTTSSLRAIDTKNGWCRSDDWCADLSLSKKSHCSVLILPQKKHTHIIPTKKIQTLFSYISLTLSSLFFLYLPDSQIFFLLLNPMMLKTESEQQEDGTETWRTVNHWRGRSSAAGRAKRQHERHFKTPPRSLWYANSRSLKWLPWQAFIVPETKKWHFAETTFLWFRTHGYIKCFKLLTGGCDGRVARSIIFTREVTQSSASAQGFRKWNKTTGSGKLLNYEYIYFYFGFNTQILRHESTSPHMYSWNLKYT